MLHTHSYNLRGANQMGNKDRLGNLRYSIDIQDMFNSFLSNSYNIHRYCIREEQCHISQTIETKPWSWLMRINFLVVY
jgi:hypothetical protein